MASLEVVEADITTWPSMQSSTRRMKPCLGAAGECARAGDALKRIASVHERRRQDAAGWVAC
jgi:hypothetical protein